MFQGRDIACDRGERRIFSGLDFQVSPGQALVLRGPNGCGKTTLLRTAATLLKAAAGKLTWNGADIAEDPEEHRARLHFIGHQDAVKGALTVRENIAVWAKVRGATEDRIEAAMSAFDIAHLTDTPAQYLSAGQHRRTALARLVASPAALWLLDEPTVSLDADGTACLQRAIAAHRADKGMVMAATHIELGLDDVEILQLKLQ
ncbi:MAG: heme ABC exporter ATP-binding protein CcmA [Rhodospirillaceae bacterium]|jgi:heme exporter protein A|nr:heme ABC exporter ATP-binding protein CcmA [Rhodospirillaceae bacterium]MBT3492082.1 heme ABC exporter ATP-binding protein CcmA [Rhodospirillaceae bacterium]MBT3781613.1 heme ABC exporter ATP-binding protein CcmA [Rhodospirillaceae bacterium]MBT3979423.1 heme ABC exporter ATP-binding protein CcmA [Rhodospirillaceae bacterium]MBT4168853.1 heme ABC exporter ATP-binding protein CcmA [Rhodospirillaceae bacterium]